MKRKMTSVLIILLSCMFLFAACSSGENTSNPASDNAQTEVATATGATDTGAATDAAASPSGESFLIGGVMIPPSSPTLRILMENVDSVVEGMGGRTQWEDNWDYSPDGLITSVEKLITAGCDGIMIFPPSDAALPKVMQLCEESGVYWSIFFRSINDEEIRNMVLNSEYYVGNTYEDEEEAGYNMGKKLGEHGAKQIAIISTSKGDTTGDTREIGFNRACEEYGMEVVAEARALLQSSDVTKAVESFIAAYPDLDGIALLATLTSTIPPACQAIRDADKVGDIVITCNDFADGMLEGLEDGTILSICGGHQPFDPALCAGMLYNAVQGTPLSENKMSVKVNVMYADTLQIAQDYFKYVESGDMIFWPDEVSTMLNKATNPNLTEADYQEIASNYTTDNLRERHGDIESAENK